ncbi:gliding motility protein [Echinicola marina]|uniref:type IX secretion system periplasmic lipoprotein PorW/SprE n=1 Tax=Echinicola marina TaxID=2859768 RepID=UPI001CF6C404|nr:gliding motility protein [Echinicola marina]UCS94097.1 gliding motility protein [Echinicola marina]
MIIAIGCSSQKDTFTNRLYHNVTAHFNAYFLAKEKINEAEKKFTEAYQEDYSQVLPVFLPIDSTTVDQNEETLEEARELAAKAIDWHRISNWVDDSYYLIGLIDYYEAQTDDAINTFKYLNVESKNNEVRHRALVQLLRIFIDQRKFDNAAYVIDFLSKEEEISKENKRLLYKTLAYYYEVRNEKDGLIAALEKTLEHTSDSKESSRLYFTLAQLYQRAGFDAQAYSYYQNAKDGNPPYERAFFAQLYSQQVAELEKSKDFKKVRAYYDELYKNRKNIDLRDVVLYEKALFELKQNQTAEAIRLLHKAAQEQGKNNKQKGYIYQKLAEVYFDQKEDYQSSKYYLDSALQYFKPTDNSYNALLNKKEVLDNFTFNYEIIQKNDSLIALSRLSPAQQEQIADKYLEREEARLLAEAEKKADKKSASIFNNLLAFGGNTSVASFYFDNPTAIQQGEIEFFRSWGNRALADDWRRKSSGYQAGAGIGNTETSTDTVETKDISAQISSSLPSKESLLANIPKDENAIALLNDELENAYFELGKVLFFDLSRPDMAREYLHDLIQKYPDSDKMPEAYYTLYLIEQETGGNADYYANKLNKEFPSSPFTKSVNNPVDKSSGTIANKNASANYSKAYDLYLSSDYMQSRQIIRSTLDNYPLTPVTDKLLLLDIMVTGKMDDREIYQKRLEQYISTTKSDDLEKMARNMLIALTGETETEQTANKDKLATTDSLANQDPKPEATTNTDSLKKETIYKLNPDQTHIFILAVAPEQIDKSKNLTAEMENFHNKNYPNSRLRTGSLAFTREYAIVLVSPFSNAAKALDYRNKFLAEFNSQALSEEIKKSSFVISLENFQQLNKRKDIAEYEAFYKASYQ